MPNAPRPARITARLSAATKLAYKRSAPKLTDPLLKASLARIHRDGATFSRALTQTDSATLVLGSARSKVEPGKQGQPDYSLTDGFGEALFKAGENVVTGGSLGIMEAAMRGHARGEKWAYETPTRQRPTSKPNWTSQAAAAAVPKRYGANITLPHEQKANEYLTHLVTFEGFLHRMEYLFRSTQKNILHMTEPAKAGATVGKPGGFGTLAEIFTAIAQKSNRDIDHRMAYGAPDDFFHAVNRALAPFVADREKADLVQIFNQPSAMADALAAQKRSDNYGENPFAVEARIRNDIEAGFVALDKKRPAFSFVGGGGERSLAAQRGLKALAAELTKQGASVRLSGSPLVDRAVLAGALEGNPNADVQAFALGKETPDQLGADYLKVSDPLTLRELLVTKSSGLVLVPDGSFSLATLFTTLCDMQTGKLPRRPTVVFDPTGDFNAAKLVLGKYLLAEGRKYINPEDLDLFQVTADPKKAARLLLQK